jgi:hypothetical protein
MVISGPIFTSMARWTVGDEQIYRINRKESQHPVRFSANTIKAIRTRGPSRPIG